MRLVGVAYNLTYVCASLGFMLDSPKVFFKKIPSKVSLHFRITKKQQSNIKIHWHCGVAYLMNGNDSVSVQVTIG